MEVGRNDVAEECVDSEVSAAAVCLQYKCQSTGIQTASGSSISKRPERPLSAYKYFYTKDRPRVLHESPEIVDLKELGKIISKRWRKADDEERRECEQLAGRDVLRYRKEMKAYKAARTQAKQGSGSVPFLSDVCQMAKGSSISIDEETSLAIEQEVLPPIDLDTTDPQTKEYSLADNHFDQSPIGILWDLNEALFGPRLHRCLDT